MWPYWVMYLAPASVALAAERERKPRKRLETGVPRSGLFVYAIAMMLLAGLRFRVGGDWGNYLGYLDRVMYLDVVSAFSVGMEPGYYFANQLGVELGIGILGPNIICAVIFFAGLTAFCLRMPRPWLAMAVSIPYLGIVVGMGYSRQAAALGFAMFAYRALARGSTLKFAAFVLAGVAFHKTAVVVLPVAILASARNRLWSGLWLSVVAFVGYRAAVESDLDRMLSSYVGGVMQSDGALIRLLMNALPAAIFLCFRKRFGLPIVEERLWYWIAIISFGLLAALFIKSSMSTALDRLALYFLPIQIVVFSRLPMCWSPAAESEASHVTASVLAYYAAVLFVWLNYATNAYAWSQYKFYLLRD